MNINVVRSVYQLTADESARLARLLPVEGRAWAFWRGVASDRGLTTRLSSALMTGPMSSQRCPWVMVGSGVILCRSGARQSRFMWRGIIHLTYRNDSEKNAAVSTANASEAGAPEIEITPEMIAAGVAELLDWDSRFEHDLGERVASIYEAMVLAKAIGDRRVEAGQVEQPQ